MLRKEKLCFVNLTENEISFLRRNEFDSFKVYSKILVVFNDVKSMAKYEYTLIDNNENVMISWFTACAGLSAPSRLFLTDPTGAGLN